MTEWMNQEGTFDPAALRPPRLRSGGAEGELQRDLAIFVNPLVVHDTHKWFGAAELRLDALVISGAQATSAYAPRTIRYPRVNDGDSLTNPETGELIYHGRPQHFLVLVLMLARDTRDSDELAALVRKQSQEPKLQGALAELGALAMGSPTLAAVQTGFQAAMKLGDLAYQLIREVSPSCLGLYRAAWLQHRDRFGMGRHPRTGTHRQNDFELAYDVVLDHSD